MTCEKYTIKSLRRHIGISCQKMNRGAGKPGHVTLAAAVNVCGCPGSERGSTAGGSRCKKGQQISLPPFPQIKTKAINYCSKYIHVMSISVRICVCVCIHIYTYTNMLLYLEKN